LEYFDELRRISVNQIIWGGNYFNLPPSRCIICWDKVQPWENFSQIELAWTSFDSPAQIFKFDNRTGDKIHPTQKPVQLYKWILNKYAKEGQTIIDTHGGSFSSAIAAHDGHFKFTGIELDADYYEAAKRRIINHQRQINLF
jgi:site-specific DNA-methyltransferase (adenine-specific)